MPVNGHAETLQVNGKRFRQWLAASSAGSATGRPVWTPSGRPCRHWRPRRCSTGRCARCSSGWPKSTARTTPPTRPSTSTWGTASGGCVRVTQGGLDETIDNATVRFLRPRGDAPAAGARTGRVARGPPRHAQRPRPPRLAAPPGLAARGHAGPRALPDPGHLRRAGRGQDRDGAGGPGADRPARGRRPRPPQERPRPDDRGGQLRRAVLRQRLLHPRVAQRRPLPPLDRRRVRDPGVVRRRRRGDLQGGAADHPQRHPRHRPAGRPAGPGLARSTSAGSRPAGGSTRWSSARVRRRPPDAVRGPARDRWSGP